MTDPIQQIEERLNSNIGMVIEYNPKNGVLMEELISNRQDIQNLLKLVKAYEDHLLNTDAIPQDLIDIKKQIFGEK